jgi:hypothetical protein
MSGLKMMIFFVKLVLKIKYPHENSVALNPDYGL